MDYGEAIVKFNDRIPHEYQITNNKQQSTINNQQSTNNKQQITNNNQQITINNQVYFWYDYRPD